MQTHSEERSSTSAAAAATKRRGLRLNGRTRKRRRTEEASGSQSHVRRSSKRKHRSSDQGKKRKSRTEEGYQRTWVYSPRDCFAYKDRFVLVSYNVLGVQNASNHLDLYCQVPPKYLNWDRRKKLICEELNLYMPSILCFQEVDRFDDLANLLEKDGYYGVYKGRTGEACDGCAIFWKEDQFTILHQENIEFRKFGLRDNVAQLCVLKMDLNKSNTSKSNARNPAMIQTAPSRTLLVGNIHVLFNPNRGDIKLGQVRVFLDKAHALSQKWGNAPIIIAGDLNSIPQSALYQFLASSELDILMHDRRNISGQTAHPSRTKPFTIHSEATSKSPMSTSYPLKYRWSEEEIQLAAGRSGRTHLQHHLKLCSAYLGVPGNSRTRDSFGEPLATSYHSKFMGTVDYIWHSEELVPVRVVETLPINILREMQGLPSENWGSDHLALVSELAFADDCNNTNA